jgi:hydroxyacylglutathione hydrolase
MTMGLPMAFDVRLVPCLSDNYAVLVHDQSTGATLLIDAPEAMAIEAALGATGWRLTDIFLTHHHGDHVAGVPALKARYGARVVGPANTYSRIEGVDLAVHEGDALTFAGTGVEVIETPGHTLDHVSYHIPAAELLFSGDTLFALGCGRLFEGTPAQMWTSLQKLRALPDATQVYCGHEYTLTNARFARSVDPDNAALTARAAAVSAARQRGEPTVPSRLVEERATNPFLRADDPALAAAIGLEGAPPGEVFARLREMRNKA